jgi:membrane associated rhomboid family serine protease
VHTLIFLGFYVTTVAVPAMFMLGYWFLMQLLSGTLGKGGSGVAFWAHIGGFVAGLLLSLVLVGPRSLAAYRSAQRRDLHSRYRWF